MRIQTTDRERERRIGSECFLGDVVRRQVIGADDDVRIGPSLAILPRNDGHAKALANRTTCNRVPKRQTSAYRTKASLSDQHLVDGEDGYEDHRRQREDPAD